MSTSIEWTDETWNPVVGCTKVSQGCKNCYAKTLHDKRHKAALAGKAIHAQYLQPFETVQLMPDRLDAPLHWRKPRRVFVNSVSDLFHEEVPDDFLLHVFTVMAIARRHTFQILTKRPGKMRSFLDDLAVEDIYAAWYSLTGEQAEVAAWPLPNVWLGVSVENQEAADKRIPLLLETPAAVRFLSCEPLLGPVDLHGWLEAEDIADGAYMPPIDWVIVGGESGPKARPCDLGWIEGIVADCDLNGVACFVKQLGGNAVVRNDWHSDDWPGASAPFAEEYEPQYQGEIGPLDLRDRKGGDPDEWPESLRVREYPAPSVPV